MVSRCILYNIFNKDNKLKGKMTDPKDKDLLFKFIQDDSTDYDTVFLIEEARNLCKTEDMKLVFDEMVLGNNITQIANKLKIENRKVSEMSQKIKKIIAPIFNKDL